MMSFRLLKKATRVPMALLLKEDNEYFNFMLAIDQFSKTENFYIPTIEVKIEIKGEIETITVDHRKAKDQKYARVHTVNLGKYVARFFYDNVERSPATIPMTIIFAIEYEDNIYYVEKKLEVEFVTYSSSENEKYFGFSLNSIN